MDGIHSSPDAAESNARQFSLRELFLLTSIVAGLFGVAVLCRRTDQFSALYSAGALAAALIVTAVWLVDRFQLLKPRGLVALSICLLIISLFVPAFGVDINVIIGRAREAGPGRSELGFELIPFGLMTSAAALLALVRPPDNIHFLAGSVAGTMGTVVNLIFGCTLARLLLGVYSPRWLLFVARHAKLAAVLAVCILLPLCAADWIRSVYPGYGLWTASILAAAAVERRRPASNPEFAHLAA